MNCLLLTQTESDVLEHIRQVAIQNGCHFDHLSDIDAAVTYCVDNQPQIVMITYVNEDVLAFAKRIQLFEDHRTVTLGIFEDEPAFSVERMVDAGIDDLLFPPITQTRMTGRLKLILQRVKMYEELSQAERALDASEVKIRTILETTVDGVVIIDEDGVIDSYNQAAERIFQYPAEEMIGKNISALMPSPYREEHDGYMRSYQETGHKKIIGIGREVKGQRKDGDIFPMELAVSEMMLAGSQHYVGIIRDISKRRTLEHQILTIGEQERRRIGEDLHDGLGQMLTGMGLLVQNLVHNLEKKDIPEAQEARELLTLLREADQQARTLTRTLVPVELGKDGLKAALEHLSSNLELLYSIRCNVEIIGTAPLVEHSQTTHFYRIIQEAMTNAARHSHASKVRVSIVGTPQHLRARVQDNGIGIDIDQIQNVSGMGLRLMKYRAAVIGASLEIRNGNANGTILTCTLPVGLTPNYQNTTASRG